MKGGISIEEYIDRNRVSLVKKIRSIGVEEELCDRQIELYINNVEPLYRAAKAEGVIFD